MLVASVSGFLAVGLGAFGAHALKDKLTADMQAVYHTGVQYHLTHTLALLAVAVLIPRAPGAAAAGWCFLAGICLFSGSLYALALSGVRMLGAITPAGGLAFLAGWACLVWTAWRS